MSDLEQQNCTACRADAPKLSQQELDSLLPHIPGWNLVTIEGVPQLQRRYRFKDFAQALAFTNKVGELAEGVGHHPALLTEWGRTTVTWWTHKIGGLHRNDFIMAAKTDALA